MVDIRDRPVPATSESPGSGDRRPKESPARRPRARRRILLLLLLVTIGAALYAVRPDRDAALDRFETATVARGRIEETVTALGKLQPRSYVDVGAQVSGQLTRILVQPGDRVQAGDLLAEIDPQLQAAKVEADRADLARLNADLADAQAQSDYVAGEFRRQTQLKQDNATRDDIFEQARRDMRSTGARLDSIRAQIVQAESTLKADEAQLGYTQIYAPMAGTVVSVDARQGQTINANYSAPVLLRIADLTIMTVWTQVSEADVTRLGEGMPLYFTTLGYGARRWEGRLRQILPAPPKPANASGSSDGGGTAAAPPAGTAGNVVLYTALFDVANPKGELRPEMTAQVFFITQSAEDALTVPATALTPKDSASGIYTAQVVVEGRIETRDVQVGIRTRFAAEILSGLQAGETVVTGLKPDSDRPSLIGFRL